MPSLFTVGGRTEISESIPQHKVSPCKTDFRYRRLAPSPQPKSSTLAITGFVDVTRDTSASNLTRGETFAWYSNTRCSMSLTDVGILDAASTRRMSRRELSWR